MRDPSGLALSSRNGYLNDSQRTEAAQLHACLRKLAEAVKSGRKDWPAIEAEARESLSVRGWQPDYVTVRRRADLRAPSAGEPLVALAAAKLGGIRLIDNVEI